MLQPTYTDISWKILDATTLGGKNSGQGEVLTNMGRWVFTKEFPDM